eukprot:scpid62621/ scgid3728/ 
MESARKGGWKATDCKPAAPHRLEFVTLLSAVIMLVTIVSRGESSTVLPNSSCLLWPRRDYADLCEMLRCGDKIYDPPYVDCVNPVLDQEIYTVSMMQQQQQCGTAQVNAPGRPRNVRATQPRLYGGTFSFGVTWEDPVDSKFLVGYRIALSLKKGTAVKYDLSLKSLRESGLDDGRYRVFFTTDKSRHSEASIRITPSSFDECFMDCTEKRDYSVKVTSLPLAGPSTPDYDQQTVESNNIEVKPCKVQGCPTIVMNYSSVDCGSDKTGSLSLCDCGPLDADLTKVTAMYQTLDESNRTSVTFTLKWNPYTRSQGWYFLSAHFLNHSNCNFKHFISRDSEKFTGKVQSITFKNVDPEFTACAVVYVKAEGLCKVSGTTTGDGQYLHVTESTKPKANSLSVSSASATPAASPSSSPPPEVGTAKESGVNASLVAGVVIAIAGLAVMLALLGMILCSRVKPSSGWKEFVSRLWSWIWRCRRPVPPVQPSNRTSQVPLDLNIVSAYLSYSRFTNTSRQQAVELSAALTEQGIDVVSDIDPGHRHSMADNREAWLEEKMGSVDFVIMLLHETHPLNLSMTHELRKAQLAVDEDDSFKLTMSEVNRIQGMEFVGETRSVVPVYFGLAGASNQTLLPVGMRMKTVYRLPKDFSFDTTNCGQFQHLVDRLHETTSPLSSVMAITSL